MTPKEKALELIKKYSPLVTTWDCYNDVPVEDEYILRDAKKCALIAVDEIIEAIDWHEFETPNKQLEYYQQVKQELEKL